jgi:DNA-binding NarL/FixJ family response regulator
MADSFTVFIIDDDNVMRGRIKDFITGKYPEAVVRDFAEGEKALEELYQKPDVVILDYHLDRDKLNKLNGIELLDRIRELISSTPVIFMSSQEKPEVADNTIKHGAYDYIIKNELAFHRLEIMINNATGHLSLTRQLRMQKIFSTLLVIILIVMVIVVFVFRMK